MALDLTASGRLNVDPRVDTRKINHMAEMVAGAKLGGYAGERARTDLRETLSTSDAPFSWAHLVNLSNLPKYDELTPTWSAIANTEIVPDFNPVTFYSFTPDFDGLQYGKDNDGNKGIAPKVAEGDTYQYAFGYTQESVQAQVEKRGFKTGWSLERAVNDVSRLLTQFPRDMLSVGTKTDDYVIYRALKEGATAVSAIKADKDIVTGKTIPVNSPATPEALRTALRQVGQRTDSQGNRVGLASSYHLVVSLGSADSIQYALDLDSNIASVQDGLITYRAPGSARGSLGRISSIIESEWLEDGEWYLAPAAGTTTRPSLVRLQLAGYTAPEVYVSNFNGAPLLGGATSSPFQAFSFDNDTVDLKFRQFTNAALITQDQLVWSNGTGA